jgi:tetratricopeptide (TPR) repeat protein
MKTKPTPQKRLEWGAGMLKPALLCGLLAVGGLSGCSFKMDWLRRIRANHAFERHDFPTGLEILQKIVARDPDGPEVLEISRQGAHVAHFEAKSYATAVDFYRHIIFRSQDPDERKSAEYFIAQIQFENLHDYNQAVMEYEKLLKLASTPNEIFRYRLNVAKSYLQMNNLDQALVEIDILLSTKGTSKEGIYEAQILKANTLIASKHLEEAASLLESVFKEDADKTHKASAGLSLAVCYEQLKNFNGAIQVLEDLRPLYPNPEFLKDRIERLKGRRENQPGAKGLKR